MEQDPQQEPPAPEQLEELEAVVSEETTRVVIQGVGEIVTTEACSPKPIRPPRKKFIYPRECI